jgi:glycosyltransferase involved in cell wall biosynthesis
VLGVGRLVAKKGFDVLVDACAVLDRRGVPFDALIVGQDDKHGDHIRARIAQRGLAQKVALTGAMSPSELLAEYRRASALCMPCRLLPDDRDGIPNVLVEAMAAGTPVVATAVSGIPELIQHGVNGLLVDPEDPEALADALLRLHGDRDLSARLRAAAQTTVSERFDGDRLARGLAALFEEAMC